MGEFNFDCKERIIIVQEKVCYDFASKVILVYQCCRPRIFFTLWEDFCRTGSKPRVWGKRVFV